MTDDTSSSTSTSQPPNRNHATAAGTPPQTTGPAQLSNIFTTPAPLKRLFSTVPLKTYRANPLPLRPTSSASNSKPTLHVFAAPNPSRTSLHPTSLRYETLLTLTGIPFDTAPSNNHAAPSGSLPYLTLPSTSYAEGSKAVPASGIKSYIKTHTHNEIALEAQAAHLALLEPVRRAYLAALYLDDETFTSVCVPLYVNTASQSSVVRAALVPGLRAAALQEVEGAGAAPGDIFEQIRAWWGGAREDEGVYDDAADAFAALSEILGEAAWFGRVKRDGREEEAPGWMDACVFAYTHVVLSLFGGGEEGDIADGEGRKKRSRGAERLHEAVGRHGNLVEHRERVLRAFDG